MEEELTLSARVADIMGTMKINQVQLAKLAGVTKGAVNQWLKSGPTATMGPKAAYTLSEKTDYEPKWLMIGEGEKKKQPGDKRKDALVSLFDRADEKGKNMIFRVAEIQQSIVGEAQNERDGSNG